MKINSFALLGILVLPLVLFTLNSGCSGKLRDAEEHYDIGTIHWKQGRIDDAIEEYNKATSIFPNFKKHTSIWVVYIPRKGT